MQSLLSEVVRDARCMGRVGLIAQNTYREFEMYKYSLKYSIVLGTSSHRNLLQHIAPEKHYLETQVFIDLHVCLPYFASPIPEYIKFKS